MSGIVGHILILVAFVSCILSVFAFYQAAEQKHHGQTFYRLGKMLWGVMTVCLFSAWLLLIVLIATHQFQYNYVWAHSSRDLPFHFLFSASWEGQEGSFLLWITMNCMMGFALIRWATPNYKAPVMTVVAFCQAFLLMMIVGIRLGSIEIGAAPFATLAEANPDAPIFQSNPDFVPADGTGLNDLLQNYWMVIHPPMLFVGFTTMIAPFAFAVVALWKRRYTQWVRPALPWTLISVMCLGVGIAMGGYWAYETLNFGGYWAWDPVENSSFVPWLVGIAAVHLMLIQRKGGIGHKAALFLSILAYMLVVYSTFLTRSGILGDASVHAFVDLGLYNQLLIWILAMGILGFGLFVWRYRELPAAQQEAHFLSREFLVFSGAILLTVIAAVVILGTSAPIFGKLFNNNPATVPIDFYNDWTLPITVGILFLAGLGQLFWWTKMNIQKINRVLIWPVLLATFSTVIVLILTPFAAETVLEGQTFWQRHGYGIQLMLLLFMAFFAFYGNFSVLWRIGRGNLKLAGGALAHVGLGVMVIGIIASSGFSQAISDEPRGSDRDNFVVEQGQPVRVAGYKVSYIGTEPGERGHTRFVLDFTDPSGQSFRLKPVAYESSTGQWIQHPDLKPYFEKDVYVAVTPRQMLDDGDSENEIVLRRGQSTLISDGTYQITFTGFDTRVDLQSILSEEEVNRVEIAVGAVLQVVDMSTNLIEEVMPIYVIRTDRSVNPIGVQSGGIGYYFTGMNVDTGQITLSLDGATSADYVVVQAQEKPAISLVWIGIVLLSGGFLLSASRRIMDIRWEASRGNQLPNA